MSITTNVICQMRKMVSLYCLFYASKLSICISICKICKLMKESLFQRSKPYIPIKSSSMSLMLEKSNELYPSIVVKRVATIDFYCTAGLVMQKGFQQSSNMFIRFSGLVIHPMHRKALIDVMSVLNHTFRVCLSFNSVVIIRF